MAQTATVQIQMPEMGESVTEGIVLEWHVAEGDFVNEGDTVVEVSTDKVDAEVPAPADGVITKLIAQVDEEVPVGAPLAEMEPGEGGGNGTAQGSDVPAAGPVAGEGEALRADEPSSDPPSPAPPAGGTSGNGAGDANGSNGVRATPVARRVAAENGVDLGSVAGSGPGSKVTKDDVLAAANGGGAAAPVSWGGESSAGACGDVGSGHGRESGGSHRHVVPDGRGRHAGRQAQGAQRAAEGARAEGLLHPPDRLGDRAGGEGMAGDGAQLRGARGQAVRDRERPGQPRHRGRHRAQGRLAQPDGAGDQGRRRARLRRLPHLLRGPDHEDPREQAHRRRLPGHQHLADQPGRDRHRRLGPPPDEGPERDRRRRRDRLPARVGARLAGASAPARRLEDDDADLDLRPPGDPGRRVGRLPAPDRTAARRRGSASTRRSPPTSASTRLLSPPPTRPPPRRRRSAPRRRPRPPAPPTRSCSARSRPPPRCSRATAPTVTSPPASTRSAKSPRATRRSSPRAST